jgi:cytochrome P450
MPYTEAVIAETLRHSSIVPHGVEHRALRDTEYKGYLIRKGDIISPNLYSIHHDPGIWGDPENFRPERFLSPDGKTLKKHEALLAFSVGRRQCLGESLARDMLFLFAANVFQRFCIEWDNSGPDYGFQYENEMSVALIPKPYKVLLKDRLE